MTVDPDLLREAAEGFISEVLPPRDEACQWWELTKDGWRATGRARSIMADREAMESTAMFHHLTGEATFAASPIRRALVIDVDLPDYRQDKTMEAPAESKLRTADEVKSVLSDVGIPCFQLDSRGGTHTWIRCCSELPGEAVEALRRLLAKRLGADFEVFPDGRRPIRLPLGIYAGRWRGPLDESVRLEEMLHWLTTPSRVSDEALAQLTERAQGLSPSQNSSVARLSTSPRQSTRVWPSLTQYAAVLSSSIWRGGQGGRTRGLGPYARRVYEIAVERGRGGAGRAVRLSSRWIAAKEPWIPKNTAGAALRRLSDPHDAGLLIKVGNGRYVLPEPPSTESIVMLEERLRTAEPAKRAIDRAVRDWQRRREDISPIRREADDFYHGPNPL